MILIATITLIATFIGAVLGIITGNIIWNVYTRYLLKKSRNEEYK